MYIFLFPLNYILASTQSTSFQTMLDCSGAMSFWSLLLAERLAAETRQKWAGNKANLWYTK